MSERDDTRPAAPSRALRILIPLLVAVLVACAFLPALDGGFVDFDDQPMLVAWRNDPAVLAHFFEHEPLSLAMQQRWYERFLQRDDE